jgi:PIN domain nuclease of toxin-antitoxin system
MRLLLDTHVFLWAVMASPQLKAAPRRAIETAEQVFVSSASIWEVAIKSRLGKIDADAQALLAAIEASGFMELPVNGAHAACVQQLPLHHQDPFDRILVAQALTEPLRLMTADAALAPYGAMVLMI